MGCSASYRTSQPTRTSKVSVALVIVIEWTAKRGRASFDIVGGGAYQKSDTRDETTGDKDLKKGRVILDWTPSQDLHVSLNLNGFTDNSDTLVGQETGLDLQNPNFAGRIPNVTRHPLSDNNDQTADWLSCTKPHDDEGFFPGSPRAD